MANHICPGCGLRFNVTLEAASIDPARPVGPSRAAWEESGYWTGNEWFGIGSKQPDDPSAKPRDEEWAVR